MTPRPFLEQQASSGGVSDAGVGTRARGVEGECAAPGLVPSFLSFSLSPSPTLTSPYSALVESTKFLLFLGLTT